MTFRACLLAATMAIPSIAVAQPVTGPYVSLGAGVDLLQNEIFSSGNSYGQDKRSYRFATGPAGEASVGYGLGNGFRVEIEGDYSHNHENGISYPVPLNAGGYEQQFGGFANVFYDFNIGIPATPYIGLGAGYQEVELDNLSSGLPGVPRGSSTLDEGNFAYQAIAGFAFPVAAVPGLALTLEYRFIGVLNPVAYDESNGSTDASGAPLTEHTRVTNVFNHEVLAGIRYAFFTPPPPAPAPAPAPVVQTQPARSYLVFFDWDRADLTDRARQIIREAAQASTHVQTTQIEVNGYTDTSGTPKYNQGLSVRRAEAVEGELVRDGVAQTEISIHGYGETHLLVATGPGVREPQNRRVEIILQ